MGGISGNINAIRDWTKNYYYDKSDIADLFIKASEGLVSYELTIIGGSSVDVTLTEDIQNNPQSYTITTDSNGEYTGLFLFHENSPLIITGSDSSYLEYTLNSQIDTIELVELVIATSIMTSNNTPNDIGVCRASSEMSYSGNTYAAWRAFDRNPNSDPQWTPPNQRESWIEYEFNNKTIIKKIEVYYPPWVDNLSNQSGKIGGRSLKTLELVASDDKTNWTSLWICQCDYIFSVGSNGVVYLNHVRPYVGVFANNTAYKVYRLKVSQYTNGAGPAISCINLYKRNN